MRISDWSSDVCSSDLRPLFFDDQQRAVILRERDQLLAIHRPDQARLVDADAETRTGRLIEAEIGECLTQIEIRLAGADDAERATFAIDDDAVDAVGEIGRAPV